MKRIYVYAGYYENYITDKKMKAPYILWGNFDSVAAAFDAAEETEDWVFIDRDLIDDCPYYMPEGADDWYMHSFMVKKGLPVVEEVPQPCLSY